LIQAGTDLSMPGVYLQYSVRELHGPPALSRQL